MLGIFTLGGGLLKAGGAILGGLGGIATAGRAAMSGGLAANMTRNAAGRVTYKAGTMIGGKNVGGKFVSSALVRGGSRLGLAALGPAGAVIGGALLAKDIYDFASNRANGGYVKPMMSGGYIVGEQGPELFMPGQSGQVLNNAETNNMLGKGTVFRNVTIGIDSFGGLA